MKKRQIVPSARGGRDVICCGMYRACSTWQYDVAAHLLDRSRKGERMGYVTGEEYRALTRGGIRPDRDRVLKSHDAAPALGKALKSRSAVGLYSYRDLRDVVYSLMHKRGMSFDQILRAGMIHQMLGNDRYWRSFPGVLVQRYDDLLADPVRGVHEVALHLGITLESGEAERVAAEFSRESNRARSQAFAARLQAAGVDLDDPASVQISDPGTLLHWNHVRAQGDGSWRTLATLRERVALDRICGGWLRAQGYEPDLEASACRLSPRDELVLARDRAWGLVRHTLRCMTAAAPRLARFVKRLLGIDPAPRTTDRPAQRHAAVSTSSHEHVNY